MREVPSNVGRILERLRLQADRKQLDMAEALGMHPSRISRIETGAIQPTPEEVDQFLDAFGGEAAACYRDILSEDWKEMIPPDPWHPDAGPLIEAVQTLRRLDEEVIADEMLPQSLASQARFFRARLLEAGSYLAILTHSFGYIGKIGDGKTTAICFGTNLIRPSRKQPRDLRDECLLATQRSRTTLCEVIIKGEPADKSASMLRFRLTVEPVPNEEVYRLVREFAKDLWDKRSGANPSSDEARGPSIEVERALRNMGQFKSQEVELAGGRSETRREEAEIAKEVSSVEELQAIIVERLRLFRRTETELVWTGANEADGRDWLKRTFSSINIGNAPTVPLPTRITVTVPFAIMPSSPFVIEMIDTKGIDGAATRLDIQAVLDNPRCVPVLCTTLGDAPGPHYDSLFAQLSETGALRQFEERAVLLILDKEKEALQVSDERTFMDVETVEQGRRIKREHARRELERRRLGGIPILFFNASEDDSMSANKELIARIVEIRKREVDRLQRLSQAVEALIVNREKEGADAELRRAIEHLQSVIEQIRTLGPSARPFFDALLRQLSERVPHQKSVLASVTRAGSWWNFDVYYAIGSGGAEDANLRSREAMTQVRVGLKNLAEDKNFASCRSFLLALSESVEKWFEAFLVAARTVATETCRPILSKDSNLWSRCEADYRIGFKLRVKGHLKGWFEEHSPRSMHASIEEGFQRAWTDNLIRPLEEALGTAAPRNDIFSSL